MKDDAALQNALAVILSLQGTKNEQHNRHCQQEAQLLQRNSASAAHMEGGWG